jgi:hypothetical protein
VLSEMRKSPFDGRFCPYMPFYPRFKG